MDENSPITTELTETTVPTETSQPASATEPCSIPVHIDDVEVMLRAIKTPYHINKKRVLKTNAFRSKPGTDDVSVMRYSHMGISACHRQAQEVVKKEPNSYVGFASFTAGAVRRAGSQVIDTREAMFCGHASIMHGMPQPIKDQPGTPQTPQVNEFIDDKIEILLKSVKFHPNVDPTSPHWDGAPI